MTSEAHSERRVRVRRMESLEGSRLSCSERGRIVGACLCMMEEVRLTRRLVAEVRV